MTTALGHWPRHRTWAVSNAWIWPATSSVARRSACCGSGSASASTFNTIPGGRMARSKQHLPPPDDHFSVAYVPGSVSLQELRDRTFFAAWSGYVEAASIRKARRIVRDLIDELIALGGRDEVAAFDAVRRAVERLNEADE